MTAAELHSHPDPHLPLHRELADLVVEASDGQISAAEALEDEPEPLGLLGLTSLGFVRLIQAVESRYGVVVEMDDDLSALDTVPALADYLRERGAGGRRLP
ncbi:phosphopantetheine-binding protein [Actinacidiphila bryophytorum]|uniref:phosphopantetheine-binding protein n=1 Tax=Actinacidiphila bryophytorum TaxID=1436133 RepID=UPI002176A195|nr:phosphopantetheine-binding protein [Actinacidiphila bryophytorum]UWE08024.1 phosphopantetheine-binding protein [Actinacidiphila bryophytorum]